MWDVKRLAAFPTALHAALRMRNVCADKQCNATSRGDNMAIL